MCFINTKNKLIKTNEILLLLEKKIYTQDNNIGTLTFRKSDVRWKGDPLVKLLLTVVNPFEIRKKGVERPYHRSKHTRRAKIGPHTVRKHRENHSFAPRA